MKSVIENLKSFRSSLVKTAGLTDNVPDGTTAPKEGERSKENSSDLKAAVPSNVEGAPVAGTGNNNTSATNAGDPTGVNVPSAKTTKEDPGTSHPAKAGPMTGGAKTAAQLANEVLAELAIATKTANEAQAAAPAAPAAPATPAAPVKTAAETPVTPSQDDDEAAGFAVGTKLAAELQGDSELTKLAATYLETRLTDGTPGATKLAKDIADLAIADAIRVAEYVKQAGMDLPPDAAGAAAGGPPMPPPGADAGGPPVPPPDAGGPGAGGAVDPQTAQIAQALLSGEITLEQLAQALSGGDDAGGAPGAPAAPPAVDKKGPAAAESASTEHKEEDKTASLATKLAAALTKRTK